MARREIVEAERGERSTFLTLSCGHQRSIGAHTLPSGEVINRVSDMLGREYDCRDARCGAAA